MTWEMSRLSLELFPLLPAQLLRSSAERTERWLGVVVAAPRWHKGWRAKAWRAAALWAQLLSEKLTQESGIFGGSVSFCFLEAVLSDTKGHIPDYCL